MKVCVGFLFIGATEDALAAQSTLGFCLQVIGAGEEQA
jgi:hypothetical protein